MTHPSPSLIDAITGAPVLFHDRVTDPAKQIEIEVQAHADRLVKITLRGRGSRAGMRSAVALFERGFEAFEADATFRILVDMAAFEGAPMMAQMSLVRWLLSAQRRLDAIGVMGGNTLALRAVRAIRRGLPFGRIITFIDDDDGLRQWRAPDA